MYTWEIINYINQRGKYLKPEEIKEVIDVFKNPQIDHIEYNTFENKYQMWDKEGNYMEFWVNNEELVRKREKNSEFGKFF